MLRKCWEAGGRQGRRSDDRVGGFQTRGQSGSPPPGRRPRREAARALFPFPQAPTPCSMGPQCDQISLQKGPWGLGDPPGLCNALL